MSKVRPEKARPGLKQLTPIEQKLVKAMAEADRKRWTELLARNKWQGAKGART